MVLVDMLFYLDAQGIGSISAAPPTLYRSIVPEAPDVLVTLFEYGGLPNEPELGKGTTRLEFPFVQAMARGVKDDSDGPRLVLQNVVTAFTKVMNQTIAPGGVVYKAIAAKQAPFFLRRDDNFRVEFVVNFEVIKDYSST